jgi:uncharacterized RDD family membrane protein YckC
MAWYYANQGQQAGPVDDAAFDNLVRQGVVRDDSLVWKEGMAEWKPYSAVRPAPMAAAPTVVMQIPPGGFFAEKPAEPAPVATAPAPAAASASQETRFCSQCGRPTLTSQLTMVNGAPTCPACAAVVHQAPRPAAPQPMAQPMGQPMGQAQPQAPQQNWSPQMQMPAAVGGMGMGAAGMQMPGAYHYAGFWIRVVAKIIDIIIVGIVGFIITLPLAFLGIGSAISTVNQNDPSAALSALPAILAAQGISSLIRLALGVAYEAYFLSTRGATLGKIALGLKVIRTDGGPISVGLAIGRYFAQIISAIILCIGYIMAGFDPQKRSLHDRICNTYVIYAK